MLDNPPYPCGCRCRIKVSIYGVAVYFGLAVLAAWSSFAWSRPLGLPESSAEVTTDSTRASIALGKSMFFDKRLSLDGSVSCASCHVPEKAFTDGLVVARGVNGQPGTRNTPSLWNIAYAAPLFWDGRRASLEEQATDPLQNPREHGLKDVGAALAILRADPYYKKAFAAVYGGGSEALSEKNLADALAMFQRSLLAGDAPFDHFFYGGDTTAIPVAAVRGFELFRGRAQCVACHQIDEEHALFTDNAFHSLGVGIKRIEANLPATVMRAINEDTASMDRLVIEDVEIAELGRFIATRQPKDIGKFRTPSLRNVALTAPYMHDGSVATLAQAVELEIYYRGLQRGRPLILTPAEKQDIIAFLYTLTSPNAEAAITGQ